MVTLIGQPSPRRKSGLRLLAALGLSVLVHMLIAATLQSGGGASESTAIALPLQARIDAPAPASAAVVAEAAESLAADEPRAARQQAPRTASAGALQRPAAGAGDNVPDARFYSARELDRYPAPLMRFEAVGDRLGPLRLWISIDRNGRVVEVAPAVPSTVLAPAAREHLLSVQFTPAMKDGRPVRSRILLELHDG